jgi:hypothetical protein
MADYGPHISAYLDPTGRNFDLIVYQQVRPLAESELNTSQDAYQDKLRKILTVSTPSGFLTGDFLQPEVLDYVFDLTPNTFRLVNRPIVHVNGWVMPIEFTGTSTSGENVITLPAPPAGATDVGADFVFLEVWRALVSPTPSMINKPNANEIYPNGNILADAGTYLPDDLINPVLALESTRRVQIQYRIRSVRLSTRQERIGYPDSNVTSQGPQAAPGVDAYAPVATDSGLWVSGSGVAGDLGTVDGVIYSIPIAIVFRRNTSPWDYLSNGNGGSLILSGVSDRPDGYYADQVVLEDVLDLRHAVSFTGVSHEHVLNHSAALLMDQNLRQWVTDSNQTGWYSAGDHVGNRYYKGDDLVPSTPVTDPPSGNTFGSVDGLRERYTDRPHIQTHTRRFGAPVGGWTVGDVITFDLLALSPLGAPLADEQPTGTVIRDVTRLTLNDSAAGVGSPPFPPQVILGLQTQTVTITMGTSPVPNSLEDLWIDFELEYPSGSGLTSHVTQEMTNFDILVHAPSNLSTAIGVALTDDAAGRALVRNYLFTEYEAAHREVVLYHTTDSAVTDQIRATDALTLRLSEPVHQGLAGVVSVVDSLLTPHLVAGVDIQSRTIFLDPLDPLPSPDDLVTVTYFPQRALPITSTPVTLYYRTAALQAIPAEYLPVTLIVNPVAVSKQLYVATASSGSALTPYPYESPSNQLPNHAQASSWIGEEVLRSPAPISIDDFSVDSGFLELPALVPFAQGVSWIFDNPVNITIEDQEFVDHYRTAPLLSYKPSAIAQGLSAHTPHKVFAFVLAHLLQDTLFARRGELIMLGIAQVHQGNKENRLALSDNTADGAAAVSIYRVKGAWRTNA